MEDIKVRIAHLQEQLIKALETVHDDAALDALSSAFIGRQGSLSDLMSLLKKASLEDKRVLGPMLNEFKQWVEKVLEEKRHDLLQAAATAQAQKEQHFDVTAQLARPRGSLHVYSHIVEQLQNIFISMGYTIADGPEVETDYYNFQALNIPADHPARDMQDTFWLDIPGMLLRTQTSNIQIRTMEKKQGPLALFAPGRVYRSEATDASHDFMFTQAECLFVDKQVSMANLLATAQTFLQQFFEKKDLNIRVRPGYFPFVEPGVEIDASCPFCTQGCSLCKKTRWIELLGAGLVHPNVMRYCNMDPSIYSGFAFGTGLERLAMIKYGISDIRLFHSEKIQFLQQF